MISQRLDDNLAGRERSVEIEVTPEMVEAGKDELMDHRYAHDLGHVLEDVYRAMAYEALSPASTSNCS